MVVILLALGAEQGAATASPPLALVAQAKIGQFAENTYFGKPSGLEDQLASLAGGVTAIDFEDFDNITMRSLSVDFSRHGLQMAVVDSGDSHTSLTAHYAAVATEMRDIAQHFSQPVLRNITEAQYLESIPQLRAKHGDRAVLRALHYFTENERVLQQEQALGGGDMGRFLELVSESGRSSWMLCQNCIVPGSDRGQAMALTLAMTARFIDTHGLRARSACRVHGGGFAGAIQLYLPQGRGNGAVPRVHHRRPGGARRTPAPDCLARRGGGNTTAGLGIQVGAPPPARSAGGVGVSAACCARPRHPLGLCCLLLLPPRLPQAKACGTAPMPSAQYRCRHCTRAHPAGG